MNISAVVVPRAPAACLLAVLPRVLPLLLRAPVRRYSRPLRGRNAFSSAGCVWFNSVAAVWQVLLCAQQHCQGPPHGTHLSCTSWRPILIQGAAVWGCHFCPLLHLRPWHTLLLVAWLYVYAATSSACCPAAHSCLEWCRYSASWPAGQRVWCLAAAGGGWCYTSTHAWCVGACLCFSGIRQCTQSIA